MDTEDNSKPSYILLFE